MGDSAGEPVTVPDVTGLPFGLARAVASAAGVALANPDPDGPPIGAIAWQRDVRIGGQDPVGGTVVTRWASVRVDLVEDDPDAEDPAPVIASTPPRLDAARATAEEPPRLLDLRSVDGP